MTDAPGGAPQKLQAALWALLGAVLVSIVLLFVFSKRNQSSLPRYGSIQPFALTNQLGQTTRLADLLGKVWVADVIFTRCAGPCPRMTEEMSRLQGAFPAGSALRLVTLTTDPEYDTAAVLKAYGEKFGADPARWSFLTGPKSDLLRGLAIGSLKLSALEKDPAQRENDNDLFIHSTVFVLVDKEGFIRGFYESLEPGFQEKIQADIRQLL